MMLSILASLLIVNCKSVNTDSNNNASSSASNEGFNKFYKRFHADSTLQMSRIKFPLNGISADGNGEIKWNKKNWKFMKIKIYDVDKKQFKVYFKKTNKPFTQKLWIENSGFYPKCRFKLTDKRWYILYFLDQKV